MERPNQLILSPITPNYYIYICQIYQDIQKLFWNSIDKNNLCKSNKKSDGTW